MVRPPETVTRLIWVYWCYGLPVRDHRVSLRPTAFPTNLNVPVTRTRPVGRYALNRQLKRKAPFILQDNERLGSAYVHVPIRALSQAIFRSSHKSSNFPLNILVRRTAMFSIPSALSQR
jgi:hypothetical protein